MKRGDRPSASQGAEEPLQITVPQVTKKSLKMRAAETGETMRVIVLKALAAAGIQVPQTELQDRRKEKG
jgi:NaMN:DMB phosphoribosyltransferase